MTIFCLGRELEQMQVIVCDEDQGSRWQQFVKSRLDAQSYHRWGWKRVIEKSFAWPTFYLMSEDRGAICGILPLVWQKSRLFGSFFSSLPFLNGGGILADGREAEEMLVKAAIDCVRQHDAEYLELRHRQKRGLNLQTKTNKITLVRAVEPDSEKMFRQLDKKTRADIRKSLKSNLMAEFGGPEYLDDFYRVFAVNMRDLGTPVYDKQFFRQIFSTFPAETYICRVRYQGTTIAASFLTGFRDSIETAWSASLWKYSGLKPNMFMYWKLLCFAGERGFRTFDFGRSSIGSGTHRFKLQWGSEEVALYWDYWVAGNGPLPKLNPQNPRYGLAIRVWKRLPVFLTKIMGPPIVRCLP